MEDKRTLDSLIKLIYLLIEKPAVFNINKVEDIAYVLSGYTLGIGEGDAWDFYIGFNDFVSTQIQLNGDKVYEWHKLIRFRSASDAETLRLYSTYMDRYLKSLGW